MMSKSAPLFRPISVPLEASDEELNALGDQLGVPTMIKPEPVASSKTSASPEKSTGTAFSEAPRAVPVLAKNDLPLAQRKTLASIAPEPATEKITVELPTYLTAALRREGAERRITTRTLVMMGLQSLGFEVNEQDLVPDGRRTRSRSGD
jgi:hypothetical protein